MVDATSLKPSPQRRVGHGAAGRSAASSIRSRRQLIALAAWFLTSNTLDNLRVRGIQSGFDFLIQPAGFGIGETVIAFDSSNPYWKAFLVGLTNTIRVAIIGILIATMLGTAIGIGRLSKNFLLRGVCTAYVELFRNIPVLCSC